MTRVRSETKKYQCQNWTQKYTYWTSSSQDFFNFCVQNTNGIQFSCANRRENGRFVYISIKRNSAHFQWSDTSIFTRWYFPIVVWRKHWEKVSTDITRSHPSINSSVDAKLGWAIPSNNLWLRSSSTEDEMKKSVSKSVSNTLVKVKTTTASPAAADTRLRGDINFRQNTTVVQGDKRE